MRWPDSAAIMGSQGSFMAVSVVAESSAGFPRKGAEAESILRIEDGLSRQRSPGSSVRLSRSAQNQAAETREISP